MVDPTKFDSGDQGSFSNWNWRFKLATLMSVLCSVAGAVLLILGSTVFSGFAIKAVAYFLMAGGGLGALVTPIFAARYREKSSR